MLPPDARQYPIRARSSRRSVDLRDAICPRYGSSAGGEVRGNVRQPLHRGLRGAGAESRAKTARHGARGWIDPAPRYPRVCTVKLKTLLIFCFANFAFGQPAADTKQRVRTVHDLSRQGSEAIP